MAQIKKLTLENWLKGESELFDGEVDPYYEHYLVDVIDENEYEMIKLECEKIHDLQKEVFDYAVDKYLEKHKYYFERVIGEIKDKEDFIKLEAKKISGWLDKHPQLQMNILANRIDVSNFDNNICQTYLESDDYSDIRDFPFDSNVKASVYTKYLDYLKGLNPKKFLTLLDFYTKGEDRYHKDMKLLTEPMEADYKNRADDSIPILERRGDEYVFNEGKGYKKYLGAYLLSMFNHGRLDFQGRGKINRDDLSQILINTFKCEKFCKNICHAIIHKKETFFEEKYLDYWK